LTVSVILALYGSTQVIVADGVAQVEQEHTRREVERALNNLSNELTYLDNVARDWATWDDTYAFVEDANPEFARSNLIDQTFTNLNINLLVIVNSSGHIVFGRAFDLANATEMPIPEELSKQLSPTGILVHYTSEESTMQGILVLGETPVLIASRPILTSNGQ
jgi:sensor domain CHASE-containing protein